MKVPHSVWKSHGELEWPPKSGHKAGTIWLCRERGLSVIRSLSTTGDGEKWIHLSVSRPTEIPNWEDMVFARDSFLGKDVEAYQVFPREEDYVNVCRTCLHIWAPVDGKRRVANLKDLSNEEAV